MSTIAIIGSGVVGRASGKGLQKKGHRVIFSDINPKVTSKLKKEGYEAISMMKLHEKIFEINTFLVSVSTPTVNDTIQLDFIRAAAASIGELTKDKKDYFLVVFRSTLPPGTTRDILTPLIAEYSGKEAGKDFGICMNPEYLREVKAEEDFLDPKIITIGALDDKSFEKLNEIYSSFGKPVARVSLDEAEMQKYIHNVYNASKISFFNEMRQVCELANIDADKIFPLVVQSAEGFWNPFYGTKNKGPYDGMCLPKDTQAFFTWAKTKHKKTMHLLRAVMKVNNLLKEKIDQSNNGK